MECSDVGDILPAMSPSRIVRWEFLGNWWFFWLLSVTVIGLPLAVLYLLSGVVQVEEELPDANRFIAEFRAGRWREH
jgi:hypothetical protein